MGFAFFFQEMEANFPTRRRYTSIAVHSIITRSTDHRLLPWPVLVIWIWIKAAMKRYTIWEQKIKVNQSEKSVHLRTKESTLFFKTKLVCFKAVPTLVPTLNNTISTTNHPTTSSRVLSTRSRSVSNHSTVANATISPIKGTTTTTRERKKKIHTKK